MSGWQLSSAVGVLLLVGYLPLYCMRRRSEPSCYGTVSVLGALTGAAAGFLAMAAGLASRIAPPPASAGTPGQDIRAVAGWLLAGALLGAYVTSGLYAVRAGDYARREGARLGLSVGLLSGLLLLLVVQARMPYLARYLPYSIALSIGFLALLIAASMGSTMGALLTYDPASNLLPDRRRVWFVVPAVAVVLVPLVGGLRFVEASYHATDVSEIAASGRIDGLLYKLAHGNKEERQQAAASLAVLPEQDEMKFALISAMADEDEDVSSSAAQALSHYSDADVVSAYAVAIRHHSVLVRYTAANNLVSLAAKGDPGARELLKEVAQDRDLNVRKVAERGLDKVYRVVSGSHNLRYGADVAHHKLSMQGFEGQVVPITQGRAQSFAVLLGAYPDLWQAEELVSRLELAGFEARVVSPE